MIYIHVAIPLSSAFSWDRAEPNMLKILPSRTSQNFDPLFTTSSPISSVFLLIHVIFIVSMITMSTIHTGSDYYTGEQDINYQCRLLLESIASYTVKYCYVKR